MSFYEYFFKFVNVKVKKVFTAAWGVELDPTKSMKYLKQVFFTPWHQTINRKLLALIIKHWAIYQKCEITEPRVMGSGSNVGL